MVEREEPSEKRVKVCGACGMGRRGRGAVVRRGRIGAIAVAGVSRRSDAERGGGEGAGFSGDQQMGTVLPTDKREMVMFGNTHGAPWTTNKTALSLSDTQLTDFKGKATKAQAALDAAEAAREASKAATESYYAAVAALRTSAADCVRTIQNKVKSSNDPSLYGLAQIPSPDPRSASAPPPAQPTDIRAQVNGDGSLTLTWKASNPRGVSGVVYKVQRALDGGAFALLDTAGEKTFNDATIPVGAASVSYLIAGKRGGQTGPMSEVFTARFGSVPGGGMVIMSTSTSPSTGMKMAA